MTDRETRLTTAADLDGVTVEIDVAEQLLLSTRADGHGFAPTVSAVHLRRAWQGLYALRTDPQDRDVREWALGQVQVHVSGPACERAQRIVDWVHQEDPAQPHAAPTREDLMDHVDWLRTLAVRPRAADRGVARAAIGLLIVVLVGMLGAGLFSVFIGMGGPWRGAYFVGRHFKGQPVLRDVRKIEFDFNDMPPVQGLGHDDWSARWDTCMELVEDAAAKFRLTSDDGSRLYIDDALVIDNWGAHPTRVRTGKKMLKAGIHHVRVEYFEASHGANVALLASFDEGNVKMIELDMLRAPGDDAANPCGG